MELNVLFDGTCPFCTASAKRIKQLDWLGRISIQDFHHAGILDHYGIPYEIANRRIQVIDASGKVSEGIDAILEISKRIPLLWILLPFVWISIQLKLGQKVYDWIAKNRFLFPVPGVCKWDPENPGKNC